MERDLWKKDGGDIGKEQLFISVIVGETAVRER